LATLLLNFAGVGQGNGLGPTIWGCISVVILNILLEEDRLTTKFTSAITNRTSHTPCISYVDDTDLHYTAEDCNTPGETLMPTVQHYINLYEGLIWATGGALVPDKGYWYLLDWKWDGEQWVERSIADMPGELTMC
jgi:hypothetical protein